ncbi:hypothetical protein D5086_031400 [Populus alba]|uniref:Uncharacterized protein n=1 Tax=Populus alba TaxID=43335 RepID=A0ACC4AIK2_POPAL
MIAILEASSFSFLQKHTLDFDGMVLLDDLEYNICSSFAGPYEHLGFGYFLVKMHVVFDFSSVPKLKRFVIGARERQLHYVFTRLSRHVPRMRSLTVKTRYATTSSMAVKGSSE